MNNKKHGQGVEYVGDGIFNSVNYQNGVKIKKVLYIERYVTGFKIA